ncbi:hypothetical protein [Cesiribacter andamanensis]|uniref:STAS/SEC14 domain-containing protein n=1 Tax=Cesiribacter andamanensis AMV16 TaxID=1279009 RepID=M7NM35_9BACT|nr:hypothetical protein [Cesiribacter andamanensis]EMR02830.1 hypothetical protein ADICEAN_02038 [Cesiribacter andamanensis AMV16]
MSVLVAGEVLLQESYVEITYSSREKIIIARWKGFLTVEQTRRGCELMSKVIAEKGLSRHLSDHAELRILGREVQEYLVGTWFYEVERLGLRKIAVRVAADIFAKATVQKVNTEQQYGQLSITTFGSCDAAVKWLKQEEES